MIPSRRRVDRSRILLGLVISSCSCELEKNSFLFSMCYNVIKEYLVVELSKVTLALSKLLSQTLESLLITY